MCHKYDIARDDQLKLYRAAFNLAAQNKWWWVIYCCLFLIWNVLLCGIDSCIVMLGWLLHLVFGSTLKMFLIMVEAMFIGGLIAFVFCMCYDPMDGHID
jgi:hypothetical protein